MRYDDIKVGMKVRIIAGIGAGQLTGIVRMKQKKIPNLNGGFMPEGIVVKYGPEKAAEIVKRPQDIERRS